MTTIIGIACVLSLGVIAYLFADRMVRKDDNR